MTGRPHIAVLHRWRDRYAEYERYLDHDRYAVSYLTTEVGAPAVPRGAAEVVIVPATDELPLVRKELERLAARHGPLRAVVALKEDDLLVAAELAAGLGAPGRSIGQLLPFRDKLLMARQVADAGLTVPPFAPAPDPQAVAGFAARHGWPVVLKPRTGSSSAGVRILRGPEDLAAADWSGVPALVQAFNPHPIHHVDGVFDGRRLGPWRASRYLDTCLDFRTGTPLGSVEVDDPRTLRAIEEFTTAVLRALTDAPTVLHLELFLQGDRCSFLEVGARVGGAEIPFLWRELHGYDLMEAAFRIAVGERPRAAADPALGSRVGGWLLAPLPAARPCVIEQATPMVGRSPGPYAESVPRPGELVPAADAYYEHVGGRFRFAGPSSAAVKEAITATARDFRVTARPVAPPELTDHHAERSRR
ncbi:hypothetical protein P3T35_005480 [Kitasatospora sp. GP30]|uniref:ATP-grasp domain-containing protein n=1 Tax=Kitasatospora sp. GP30 TaxID=3035084 RepID=UPI000C700CB9|nr:biotin carboxylase [Kitasatospora sp. GP30]MDH6143445.1 hypothetical protein [Kitasatospora sp. GP30]